MKTCFRCLADKPLTEFYGHPAMGDGRLGKCKTCTKVDVRRNRLKNVERVRAYDRQRAKSAKTRERIARIAARWAELNPARRKAVNTANNAVRDGRLDRETACEGCGREVRLTKHHHDYDRPLLVMWLCRPCHSIADKIRRKFEAA
jgi:hypothetical protein